MRARRRRRSAWRLLLFAFGAVLLVLPLGLLAALWATLPAPVAGLAAEAANIVVGGDGELEAAGLGPRSAEVVIVKHGPDGVTVHQNGTATRIPPMPVTVVNGLGAGDAFLAAFSAALLDGVDPVAAARRGSAAGALVATRLACSDAMPTVRQIEDFIEASQHA